MFADIGNKFPTISSHRKLLSDSTQATQNFSIGVTLDVESDGNENFQIFINSNTEAGISRIV